jgi:hypothetical protein
MRSDRQPANPAIGLFTGLNIVLAVLCALWLLVMCGILVYGVGFSGDQGEALAAGVFGCVLFAAPGFIGLVVYLAAGIGLARRQAWGYYMHCTGAILAGLTCIGLVYTVPALIYALRPEFSGEFFDPVQRRRPRRRVQDEW